MIFAGKLGYESVQLKNIRYFMQTVADSVIISASKISTRFGFFRPEISDDLSRMKKHAFDSCNLSSFVRIYQEMLQRKKNGDLD